MTWQADKALVDMASKAQQALLDVTRHVWVSAHAGTGKTETLTRRVVALLLADAGLSPREILAMTFTRAGAGELRVRLPERVSAWVRETPEAQRALLADILGRDATEADLARLADLPRLLREEPLWVTTFHGLCSEILTRFPEEAGVQPGYGVLTEPAQRLLLEKAQLLVLRQQDTTIEAALDVLVPELGDTAVRGMVDMVSRDWDKLVAVLKAVEERGGIEKVLAEAAGGMTEEPEFGLKADERDVLLAWQSMLEAGSTNDLKQAARLRYVLEHPEHWSGWRDLFFINAGTPRANFGATRKVQDTMAAKGLEAPLAALMERVVAWRQGVNTARGYALTRALVVWVARVREAYEQAKKAENVLDYDDLIAATEMLLNGWDADRRAWVMMLLDRDIKHILLDEGQDNSHVQNTILQALAAEMLAGGGRTLLAVGDLKQSIYRFRGAAPRRFTGLRAWLEERAGGRLVVGELAHSFRSSPSVLVLADTLWRHMTGEDITHHTVRPRAGGWVVRRPLLVAPSSERDSGNGWLLAEEKQAIGGRDLLVMEAVVHEIEALAGKKILASTGSAARYGDIMVLVKKNDTGALIAAALTAAKIPVRMANEKTALPLLVRDVLALVRVLLAETDRHSLGQVLASPWVGWSQARLHGWLFGEEGLGEAAPWLEAQRSALRDGGLTAWLVQLENHEVLGNYAARMHHQPKLVQAWWQALVASSVGATDAHAWAEHVRLEGLPGFVPPADNAVTITTVHKAKGLEAPVVVLAETTKQAGRISTNEKLLWEDSETGPVGVWFYRSRKIAPPVYQEKLKEAEEASLREDDQRALYVAVTRAKEGLVVLGAATGKEENRAALAGGEHWFGQLGQAMEEAGATEKEDGLWLGTPPHAASADTAEAAAGDVPARPAWAEMRHPPLSPPLVEEENETAAFGARVHKVLEHCAGMEEHLWDVEGLQAAAGDRHACEAGLAVLRALPELFGNNSMAEVEVVRNDGTVGRIDRLVVTKNEVWVVDFKTDANAPDDLETVKKTYKSQLHGYTDALRDAFGPLRIRGALVYTQNPKLIWVED